MKTNNKTLLLKYYYLILLQSYPFYFVSLVWLESYKARMQNRQLVSWLRQNAHLLPSLVKGIFMVRVVLLLPRAQQIVHQAQYSCNLLRKNAEVYLRHLQGTFYTKQKELFFGFEIIFCYEVGGSITHH